MKETDKGSKEWIREKKKADGVLPGKQTEEDIDSSGKASRIINILVVAILLCIIALAGVLLYPTLHKQVSLDTAAAYRPGGHTAGTTARTLQSDMQTKLFASDLCVTPDGIENPAISITDETEGNILVNL